jgi:hypothetical protein
MKLNKRSILIACVLLALFVFLPIGVFIFAFSRAFAPADYSKSSTETVVRDVLRLNIPRSEYSYIRIYGRGTIFNGELFVRYSPPKMIPAHLYSELNEDDQVVWGSSSFDDVSGWNMLKSKSENRLFLVSIEGNSGDPGWFGNVILDTESNVLLYRLSRR